MNVEHEIVDMGFPIRGRAVPRDHGYALYGALCREVPALHGAVWLGVHPIRGERLVDDAIGLRDHSAITLRLPVSEIGTVLPLAGRELNVGGALIALRTPIVVKLASSETLDARAVVFKLTDIARSTTPTLDKMDLERAFRAQLARVLATLVDRAPPGTELTGRQQITVGGRRIVGYSVRLTGLAPAESLRIQTAGIGGKRRMGCGVFTPSRPRAR